MRIIPALFTLLLITQLLACGTNLEKSLPTDGDQNDGDISDGDQPDGDTPDGDQPDGDTPDGDTPDGDIADGDATDGDQPDGDIADGDATDGDIVDGDATDGDATDGDASDGDTDESCPETWEGPAPPDCVQYDCTLQPYPNCWQCTLVADLSQNGASCSYCEGDCNCVDQPCVCDNGACVDAAVDGDDTDGDVVDGDDADGDIVDGDDVDGDLGDCPADHYGPNCDPCLCVHGLCDDGIDGTGACDCQAGYTGPTCNTAHDCCVESNVAGCSDNTIEACVCAQDSWCCWGGWDHVCIAVVEEFGCAVCTCPGDQLQNADTGECFDDPCAGDPCVQTNKTLCRPDGPGQYTCLCEPGYIADGETCIVNPNPTGLSCLEPIPLNPAGEQLFGTTAGGGTSATSECGGSGAERVHALTLASKSMVDLTVTGFDAVLYVRGVCDDKSTEIACNDDSESKGDTSKLKLELDPGTYFIFVDSYGSPDEYTFNVAVNPDPCAGDPCPGLPECEPNADWSDYSCYCPAGTLPYDGNCVDDPCEPNPCTTETHRTRCDVALPVSYTCQCAIGYIEDEQSGDCVEDPDANEWAFFVFLNADNNLEDDGWEDLEEMETAGSNAYVHIVTLMDTASGVGNKYYVEQGSHSLIENVGEIDMSDWRELAAFGEWAVEAYPARHVALIMWDHGAGWEKAPLPHPILKGFSNDDHGSAGEISISNGDYARALAAIVAARGSKLDLVGFDACLMGMWEVAEASAPYADYLVASQETEPGWGWPYDYFLPDFVAAPLSYSPQDLGEAIVEAYHAHDSNNATLSLVDLNTMNSLANAMTSFANQLMVDPNLYAEIETMRKATQQLYYFDDFRDLKHFAMQVEADTDLPTDLRRSAQALVTQLNITIVHSLAHSSHPNAYGMSIFFPGSGNWNSNYRGEGAVWSDHSTWDDFVYDFTH